MTIDERLEELTERHEALTQMAELMSRMRQQDSENIRALVRIAEKRLAEIEGGE
jgi:HD superfamily phosphodiesterase